MDSTKDYGEQSSVKGMLVPEFGIRMRQMKCLGAEGNDKLPTTNRDSQITTARTRDAFACILIPNKHLIPPRFMTTVLTFQPLGAVLK